MALVRAVDYGVDGGLLVPEDEVRFAARPVGAAGQVEDGVAGGEGVADFGEDVVFVVLGVAVAECSTFRVSGFVSLNREKGMG